MRRDFLEKRWLQRFLRRRHAQKKGEERHMRESFLNPEEKTTDNYLKLCDIWREKYLALDREELKERFHLESDEHAHYITYFGQRYRLDQRTGMLTLAEAPDRELTFNTVMTIYHLFYYAKPRARVSNVFVPFRQVKRAAPFDAAFRRNVLDAAARAFDGHLPELHRACETLGGKPLPQGDAGYQIEAFSCMPLQFLFWDGDEEFPAQANILFDADITDFLHEETVVCVGDDLFRRLLEEAGLSEVRRPFDLR